MNSQWIVSILFVVTFVLILVRRFPIYLIALASATIIVALGIVPFHEAITRSINWAVLAIYSGYGLLAIALRESGMPAFLAGWILPRVRKEKYALLFLCVLAAFLSSFMANPVVVLMLAPLAIEISDRLKSSLFLYLVSLAVASNVVTTVSMVADPPALILAMKTGMRFLDFYWFQNRPGLGTVSIIGVIAALLTLLFQFRSLNKTVDVAPKPVRMTYGPTILFVLSVVALAIPPLSDHAAVIGIVLGAASFVFVRRKAREVAQEFDWKSLLFLIGIFVLVDSVDRVGLLRLFADLLPRLGIRGPVAMLSLVTWLSVALSSFIDNVPYTVLMIPTCAYLSESLGMNPFVLYFGMLVGTGIGGNLTPIGATANVLAVGMLEKRGYKIRLGSYLAIGLPFTIVAVLAVQLLLIWIWL